MVGNLCLKPLLRWWRSHIVASPWEAGCVVPCQMCKRVSLAAFCPLFPPLISKLNSVSLPVRVESYRNSFYSQNAEIRLVCCFILFLQFCSVLCGQALLKEEKWFQKRLSGTIQTVQITRLCLWMVGWLL